MVVSCLLENTVTFEPVGSVTSVFFDDKNQQVFSVRSGGATGILVRGFSDHLNSTFRLEDKGPIIAIKLSPDQTTLAVQRLKNAVHFVPVSTLGSNGILDTNKEYSQSCRVKNANILGFYWTLANEVVYITTQSIEVYSLVSEKQALKYLRSISHQNNWFSACSVSSLLVISTASTTSVLQPFLVKQSSNITKLSKIELDKYEAREKDVHIVTLYSQQYIVVILHPQSSVGQANTTDVALYSVSKDGINVTKTHVLKAPFESCGLALNVTDNLLMIHNRPGGRTALFDIALSVESDGMVAYHNLPVVPVVRVAPSKSSLASLRRSGSVSASLEALEGDQAYSLNWVTFFPDIIIDAKEGVMWKIKLKLDSTNSKMLLCDLPRLVGFLHQREGAKIVLLDVLLEWCSDPTTDISSIGAAFNLISHEYRQYLNAQILSNMALPVSFFLSPSSFSSPLSSSPSFSMIRSSSQPLGFGSPHSAAVQLQPAIEAQVILDEADLYTHLFSQLAENVFLDEEDSRTKTKRVTAILMEYVRSLQERQIPIQHFLNELLINLLVRQGSFFLLHQLLQYHVISDSKPLACLLLSMENVYPPSYQLALDMLVRLNNSSEEICEILLSKGFVLSALKFATKCGIETTVPSQKFLEAAKSDPEDFHTVYTFLKERNLLPRSNQDYTKLFQKLFETSD